MKRLLVALSCVGGLLGCIDFDGKLERCDGGTAPDCGGATGGGTGGATGGGQGGGSGGAVDAGDDAGTGGATDAGPDAGAGGSTDAGDDAGTDAGTTADAGTDAGAADAGVDAGALAPCPGFSANGWCWMNPTPAGHDWLTVSAAARDDVWVAGAAGGVMHWDGAAWHDYQQFSTLQSNGYADVKTVALSKGTVVIGGNGLGVSMLSGSTFTPVANMNVPNANTITAGTVSASGKWVFTSESSTYFVGNGSTYLQALTSPAEARCDSIAAIPDAGFVMGCSSSTKDLSLEFTQSGTVSLPSANRDNFTVNAVWLGPDPRIWFSGGGCFAGWYLPTTGSLSSAEACDGGHITSGHWSPALDSFVLTSADGRIFEPTLTDMASSWNLVPAVVDVPPQSSPRFNAATTFADGGGLAVGVGGLLAWRDPTAWVDHGSPLRSDLDVVVPFGSGVLIGGGDEALALLGATDSTPQPVQAFTARSGHYFGGWTNGTVVWVAGTSGSVKRVNPNTNIVSDRSVIGAGLFRCIEGPDEDHLWVGGIQGGLQQLENGTWKPRNLAPIDGGDVDLYAAATWQGDVYLGGNLNLGGNNPGILLRAHADGGVDRVATLGPNQDIRAMAASDAGLYLAGTDNFVACLELDGGLTTLTPAGPVPVDEFKGLVVLDDGSVWVLGNSGVLRHLDARAPGAPWLFEEIGARRWFGTMGHSRSPGGRDVLWLVGDHGAVLRKVL